jgi:hypothetical protein
MKRINLKITKANIKNGVANPSKCPIANSILENVKNAYYVCVLPDQVAIKVKKGSKITAYRSQTPKVANTFIKKFDDGQKVTPFSFRLSLVKVNKNFSDFV